jgi:NAD(P)-dependent dehydrogenase (short-subunit alcohol dehydrogenase family)
MSERRAIFISGGGSGIGRAVAQLFGARGWFIGLGDVNEAGMIETESLLPGGYSYRHKLDVRDRAQWEQALDAFAIASGGRIDVLFNNAGVAFGGSFARIEADEIDALIDINFRGVVNGAQAAYPHLKRASPGSVLVNTSSAAALYGTPNMAVYSATKFAVRGLTEALDSEWAKDGIRVCSLMPSFIDTPLLAATGGRQSNTAMRDSVMRAGLEFTPVEQVAETVWQAVHGRKLHNLVGKTAKKLAFAAKWTPGKLRPRGKP